MPDSKPFIHPYIPNSVLEVERKMMEVIGISDIDELFQDLSVRSIIPELPGPLTEYEIHRRLSEVLSQNRDDLLVFCGSGTWPHYVPAVVDEIINRTEFKTTYTGFPETERGKWQAIFEFQSLIAELIEMDMVNSSVYSEPAAAGEALNMARRLTDRQQILVPASVNEQKLSVMENYVRWSGGLVRELKFDPETGRVDLKDLSAKISTETAAVFLDNPTGLGVIEDQVDEIAAVTHKYKALLIVSVDPISLGILRPPGDYDADIVVGSGQPLGLHMNFGGNSLGFFGCRDTEAFRKALPGNIVACASSADGEDRIYSMVMWERHFFHARENATSMIGSSSHLCAIANAVYLSLLGPRGMQEIGEGISRRTQYALQTISSLQPVAKVVFTAPSFKEFAVSFESSNKTVAEINRQLWTEFDIVGGRDLSKHYPELGKAALFCVTEIHTKADIDRLFDALKQILEVN